MSDFFRIYETTHHGDFYKQIFVETNNIDRDSIDRLLEDSPYNHDLDDAKRDTLVYELTLHGRAIHGWATYELGSLDGTSIGE